MKRILKISAIIISLLLAGVLAFFLWQEKKEEKAGKAKAIEMEKELRPLEVERNRLRQELDNLKTDHKNSSKGTGSMVLLFTDLSEQVYTEIFPQMKECGFVGMLAISGDQRPGHRGCISPEQFREMTDAGWKCCLRWEEDEEPEEWLASCRAAVQELQIEVPQGVYFPADTYSSKLGRFLKKEGFGAAVHHGEEELPVVVSQVGEDFWYPGAAAWNQDKASHVLGEAISRKGNLVFTVGADSKAEKYVSESFASMLKQLQTYRQREELIVTDLAGAKEYHRGIQEEQEGMKKEFRKQEEELEKRIEELAEEIEAVTKKYI